MADLKNILVLLFSKILISFVEFRVQIWKGNSDVYFVTNDGESTRGKGEKYRSNDIQRNEKKI